MRIDGVFVLGFMLSTAILGATELSQTRVVFDVVGKPSFIRIHGEGTQLSHQIVAEKEGAFEVFVIPLADLKTGIDVVDERMKKDYLKVKDFPVAKLKIPVAKKSVFDFPSEKTFEGTLSLHGQTRPVRVSATTDGEKVTAHFEIKMTDYGIEVPQWTGARLADTVTVGVSLVPLVLVPELAR